jgi:hypothetical protein
MGYITSWPGPCQVSLPPRVNVDDGCAVKGAFVVFGTFSSRVNSGVFEQQHRVSRSTGDDGVVHLALLVPGTAVVDKIRGKTDLCELNSHSCHFRRRRKFA